VATRLHGFLPSLLTQGDAQASGGHYICNTPSIQCDPSMPHAAPCGYASGSANRFNELRPRLQTIALVLAKLVYSHTTLMR